MAQRLATQLGCTIYAPDARNHGASPHAAPFTLENMVLDLRETLLHLQYKEKSIALLKPVVIGHSLGGLVTARYLQNYDSSATAAMFVDITPRQITTEKLNEFLSYCSAMRSALRGAVEAGEAGVTLRSIDHALQSAVLNKQIRSFLLTNLERGNDEYYWRLGLSNIAEGLKSGKATWNSLKPPIHLKTPSLFLYGEKSEYWNDPKRESYLYDLFEQSDVRKACRWEVDNNGHIELASKMRNSILNFATVPQAGHWPHAENPNAFFHYVTKFYGFYANSNPSER